MGTVWGRASVVGCCCLALMAGGCTTTSETGAIQSANATLTGETPPDQAQSQDARATNNLLKLASDVEARGSVATALPFYERAAVEPGASAEVHAALGDAYVKLGRDKDAADAYRRALAREPENRRALFELGSTMVRNGELAGGLKLLEKAAPLVNTPQAYNRLGVAHIMSGQPKEALAAFEQAYKLNSKDADIATNAALAAALMGQHDRAVTMARATLTYTGLKPYHRRNLVLVLGLSKQAAEAKSAAGVYLSAAETEALVSRAAKIRAISSPKARALALGTMQRTTVQ